MKAIKYITTVLVFIGPNAFAKDVKVTVKGMVCAFCAQGVSMKIQRQDGVENVDVSLEKKLVTIHLKDGKDLPDEKIKSLLTDSGYDVEKIDRGGP